MAGCPQFRYPADAASLTRVAMAAAGDNEVARRLVAELGRALGDRDRAVEDWLSDCSRAGGEPDHDQNMWEDSASWSHTNASGADQSNIANTVTITLAQPTDMPSLDGNLILWYASHYSWTYKNPVPDASVLVRLTNRHTVDSGGGGGGGDGTDDQVLEQRFLTGNGETNIMPVFTTIMVPYNAGDSRTMTISLNLEADPASLGHYNVASMFAFTKMHAFFEPGVPIFDTWHTSG